MYRPLASLVKAFTKEWYSKRERYFHVGIFETDGQRFAGIRKWRWKGELSPPVTLTFLSELAFGKESILRRDT